MSDSRRSDRGTEVAGVKHGVEINSAWRDFCGPCQSAEAELTLTDPRCCVASEGCFLSCT